MNRTSFNKNLFVLLIIVFIAIYLPTPAYSENQPKLLFSFIQVTDTQYANLDQTSSITDFVLANKTQYKIEYVVHTGDIAEGQFNSTSWNIMNTSFSLLNGHVAFGWLAGNHDYDNKTEYLGDDYFAFNPNNWNLTSSLKEGRNTAQHLTFYGRNLLFVNIEFYASNDVWQWFEELYNRYYDSTVILTTHSYLNPEQGTYANDTINPTVFSEFPRVKLVLCGHRNFAYNQQIENREEIAFDRQYRNNFADESDYFRIYSIYSEGTVNVLTYSNLRDSFLTDPSNNFSFRLFESPAASTNPTAAITPTPTPANPQDSPAIPEIQLWILLLLIITILTLLTWKTRSISKNQ
jgi:hypothetical protein